MALGALVIYSGLGRRVERGRTFELARRFDQTLAVLTGTNSPAFLVITFALVVITPRTILSLVATVMLAGTLTACAMSRLLTSTERKAVKAEFSALGTTIPWAFALLYIALLVAVSTSFFAAVLYLLDRYHVVTFYVQGKAHDITMPTASLFFLHELVSAVPAADLTQAFRWDAPFTYTARGVGVLVVGFKLLVITPAIAFAFLCLKVNRSGDR
jgi:hypothetical protein